MYRALLETGLLVERSKHFAVDSITAINGRIEAWCDAYDQSHGTTEPCTGDLLCSREGTRHKSGCTGKVEPFTAYVRGLR